ncbi:MAG: MBL fold metallo-hydrolase [Clostridia bacterium]|nr:MBL fold metallo-hydrolase [Clostridia bacterium]NCD03458.1 MBL fold metallo-hydrolase [Clostridia bacterium]
MKFGTIASGSSGNCLYAGNKDTHILIDAGISCKRICEGLKDFEVEGKDIQGILLTHEHTDHIAGIGVLSRKFHIPIYATEGTLRQISEMGNLGKIDRELFQPIEAGREFKLGSLSVESFSISHDAAEPVSYVLREDGRKLGMVTDLGYYDESIVERLKDSNFLYVEANHDIHMLQAGPYPYYLKRRILGDKGHLCNEMAAQLITELACQQLERVTLGHLSKENNYPDLALATVRNEVEDSIGVQVAPRECSGPLLDV